MSNADDTRSDDTRAVQLDDALAALDSVQDDYGTLDELTEVWAAVGRVKARQATPATEAPVTEAPTPDAS